MWSGIHHSITIAHFLLNTRYTGATPTFYIEALRLVTNVQQLEHLPQ